MRSYKTLAFVLLLIIMPTAITSSFAEIKTLKGGNERNWDINGSWTPSGVPTASDDVILAISSSNLTIDANAVCGSFTIESGYSKTISFSGTSTLTVSSDWTNNGAPVLGSGLVLIAGNFTNNSSSLDVTITQFTFNNTGNQTIYSASNPLPDNTTFGDLIINKPSGTIQLSSDVAVENTITETNGTLDLNGNAFWINGSPLPVELSSFSAVILENGIKLKWRTETEVSNYGFEILRSAQNDKWDLLGFVNGHGNSNSPKEYSFVDENVTAGKFSYRLKQIDTDGKFEYSKVIEVDLGSPMNYELSQNYPNPFNPSTTIRYSVSESSFINLSIFNSLGEKIKELVNDVRVPGVYTVEFNAKNYPSGTYLYSIQSDYFTSTKKMILVK